MAVQSDRAPAAANFVNVLFICNPPLAWPRRRRTDGSAEAGRSHSRCNYSMVTQLRQFASRPAHDRLCLGAVCRNAIRPHSPDAWHWSITQIVEHCLPACHDGFVKFLLECLAMWPQRHTLTRLHPPMSATQNSALETGTTRPICKGYMYL